jgi:transcriptional regulator with XRE-family HTH domain
VKSHDTQKELAKVAGVSHDTIARVETIEKKADEHTKQLVRTGEKSINQAYNEIKAREIKRMPTAQEYQDAAKKRHDAVKDTKTVSIADLQQNKEDRKILEDAAIAKVRRALHAVSMLYVETSNRELNIDILSQSVKERLSGDVKSMISELKAIQTAIERE